MEAGVLLAASGVCNKINDFKRGSWGRIARNQAGNEGKAKRPFAGSGGGLECRADEVGPQAEPPETVCIEGMWWTDARGLCRLKRVFPHVLGKERV